MDVAGPAAGNELAAVMTMRHGIDICVLGEHADPGRVVELARAAEAAGWEALFVWDHLAFAAGMPSIDPWVALSAVAAVTTRLRLGTAVTPLPRRRPAVVANAVATLDRLSGGRVTLGVGIGGVPLEFSAFGEPDDARRRGAMLDEALEVITALWSGRPVSHQGPHYRVAGGITLAPLPVQRPRVPIWVGGDSGPARRRAARWDGWIIAGDDQSGQMTTPPERIARGLADVLRHRSTEPFDLAMTGVSTGPEDPVFARYAAAGVTWWLEHIHGLRAGHPELLARIEAGPPSRS
jgi:probable F420-dependent oxidoreductase